MTEYQSLDITEKEYKLSNKYTLWFHHIDDTSFEDSSFTNIYENIDSIKKFIVLLNNIPIITSGMFFFMKHNYFPKLNKYKDGGLWTFKVSKKNANESWENICSSFIGNTLMKNVDDMKSIIGISISPKINNCIIKIWNINKNKTNTNLISDEIPLIHPNDACYKHNRSFF